MDIIIDLRRHLAKVQIARLTTALAAHKAARIPTHGRSRKGLASVT